MDPQRSGGPSDIEATEYKSTVPDYDKIESIRGVHVTESALGDKMSRERDGTRKTPAGVDVMEVIVDEPEAKETFETEKPHVTEPEQVPVAEDAEQSKYMEVRAGTDLDDDPTMPAETFRAYTIGIILTVIGASISNVTELREEPLVVDSGLLTLIALPIGRWWARWMPKARIGFGKWSFQLNPGTFTVKEHTLICVMASVGAGSGPYAISLIAVQMVKFSWCPDEISLMIRSTVRILVQCTITHHHGNGWIRVCWSLQEIFTVSF